MATYNEITAAIELGWAYYVEQLEVIRLKQVEGCFVCTCSELSCLASAIQSLEYDVEVENNSPLTTIAYNQLLSLIANFTGAFTADPTVQIAGITILDGSTATIAQTAVVTPGDGVSSYVFPELIGNEALSVYRGTGTTLRAHTSAATDEFAQINYSTGTVTVNYPFGVDETLWVSYKITT